MTKTAKATKPVDPKKPSKTDEVIDPATIAKGDVTSDTMPKQNKTDKVVTQTVTTDKKLPETKIRPEPKPKGKAAAALPDRVNGGFSEFSTDGAGGRVDDPKSSVLAPNQNTSARFDNEATIARYRQSGDLANVIQALRRAINDKPKDVALRRQLILAYKERNLLDSALAEANRALQILPEESGLYRAKGDILTAKGDTAAATLAYNQAIQRGNGSEIGAQVALADSMLADGRFEDAIKGYEVAAKTDPNSPCRCADSLVPPPDAPPPTRLSMASV